MQNLRFILFLAAASALTLSAGDDNSSRIGRATKAFRSLTGSAQGVRAEQLAAADCIAVIPGFKKGTAVVGVGFGKGFISCRTENGCSAPGAITLESSSLGVQVGGEKIDIVMLSLDKGKRAKLLSDRFTIGSDASAAWGNGKSAHEDPNAKVVFFGHTEGIIAGFGLDGATVKPDHAGNKALYGKPVTNSEIINEAMATPPVAEPFVAKLPK